LRVLVRRQIARQFDRIEFGAVAQRIGFADERVGDAFKKVGRRRFKVLTKS
jgi:hypothetical protein